MADCTVLGMPLDVDGGDVMVTAQPIAAFVIVKALDEDGDLVYLAGATEGLPTVECLGMAEYAVLRLRHGLTQRLPESGG